MSSKKYIARDRRNKYQLDLEGNKIRSDKNMARNKKEQKGKYKKKTIEQTISTDCCMFGRVSKKGNHVVLQNTGVYDFSILIEKESLEELLEGTHETDYVFANFIVNEDEE